MSENQFLRGIEDLMKSYKRRIEKLQAVQRGDAKLKRVHVRGYKVHAYEVRAHYRFI